MEEGYLTRFTLSSVFSVLCANASSVKLISCSSINLRYFKRNYLLIESPLKCFGTKISTFDTKIAIFIIAGASKFASVTQQPFYTLLYTPFTIIKHPRYKIGIQFSKSVLFVEQNNHATKIVNAYIF